jgi:hypothetical protein
MNLLKDIYYNKNFSKLYLQDDYTLFEFKFEKEDNVFYNLSIKKPIKSISGIEVDGYFDLETPYGYGGFYTNCNDKFFINEALKSYKQKCIDEKIIAEFFSFHPYNLFPENHNEIFDACFKDRDVVTVNLSANKDERWSNYQSKIRTILRKCYKELSFEKTTNLDDFKKLYYQTMEKNNAKDFYFFDDKYFDKLISFNEVGLYSVKLGDQVIAMSFMMFSENVAHYHLSANNTEYLNKNANYYILDKSFDIAREKGCEFFLLGGGRTPSVDDNLYRFKSKFSKETKDFYLAGNIYNKEVYEKYILIWEDKNPEKEIKYFLKYRLN